MPTTIKLTDYLNDKKVKYIEMNLVLQHGQKRPKPVQPYYKLTPTFGDVKPNKEGKIISQNVFTDKFYQEHQKQVRLHMNIDEYNAIGVDTRQIQQLDFDTKTPEDQRITEEMKCDGGPFFLSYSKRLPHFVFPSEHNLEQNTYDMFSKVTHEHLGEFLCGQWSYARPGEDLQNYEGENTYWGFDIYDNPWIYSKATDEKEPVNKNQKITEYTSNGNVVNSPKPAAQPEDEKPEAIPRHTKELLEELGFECLDHEKYIKQSGNYNTWCKLIWSLHEHKELAKKLSELGGNRYDESVFESTFNSFDSTKYKEEHKNISLGTFFHFCKDSNPEKYKRIMFKHNWPLDFLNFTDIEIAEWLCKICGDDFVYKDIELFVWIEKQKRWHQDDNKTSLTIEYISKRLTQEGKKQIKKRGIDKILDSDEPDNISKSQMELVKKITQLKILKHIKPIAESFLIKLVNRFDGIEFDKNPYLYAFKNCVYDFKDKNFRAILKSDYLMMNTKYNWEQPTKDQVNEVASIFESIFPNKDARKGYASVLFSGLLGICPEKFVMANGSGRNGKGLLHDLFKKMSGDYACKGHIDVLIEKMKSGANPEVASFDKKKRAIFFSEPDITHPLNVASLKELSGGGELNARDLYSSKMETVLMAIVIMEVNQRPSLNGTDSDSDALREKLLDFLF